MIAEFVLVETVVKGHGSVNLYHNIWLVQKLIGQFSDVAWLPKEWSDFYINEATLAVDIQFTLKVSSRLSQGVRE